MIARYLMKNINFIGLLIFCRLLFPNLVEAEITSSNYVAWRHSGVFYIMTTPDGANLRSSAVVNHFPLLFRLSSDFFEFSQAKLHGEDIRFTTGASASLAYQIEEWDVAHGTASIWLRVPVITGNERHQLKMFWGKSDANSESSGTNVFNESNGYLSIWHMNEPVQDDAGTVAVTRNDGTMPSSGVIGQARHFAGEQGISAGENITNYPSGTGPMTTEAWFRAEKPNVNIVAWGREQRPGKVMMKVLSPPTIGIHCYFADVNGKSPIGMNQWYQVVHTYQNQDSRVYVNGQLDGVSTPVLDIPKTSGLWMGGWHDDYNFRGEIDEVRISKVVRSPDWIKLQYENQKPRQTVVGPLVQPGNSFSVSPETVTVMEGKSVTLSAKAGGAQKIYWILKRDNQEAVVAVDRFHYIFTAGRIAGDQTCVLQLKAIYANEVKTRDVAITIREDIRDPVLTLKAPVTWNGRETIEVVAQIANLDEMQAKGAGALNYAWSANDIAVAREITPGKLILKRALKSGPMTVSLTVDNGGSLITNSITIQVNEPKNELWVKRTPAADEKPEDNQFYARDDHNEGTLYYHGVLPSAADSVYLKVYAGDAIYQTKTSQLSADKSYAFSVKLKSGLVKYSVEFGTKIGNHETVVQTATNLVCGDAYLIDGQSNAEAVEFGDKNYPFTSDWIRSFGYTDGNPEFARLKIWGNAVARSKHGKLQIGYWGLELGRHLVEDQKMPVCIINGAVGGTRIDKHQRNPFEPEDVDSIYGRLLWRVEQARLTDGIRSVLWHQGENDQGADGPTGDFGWKTYRQYFFDMSASWKQDYPNIQHYYLFQIWPKSCAMGIDGSDNRLREVQRLLPKAFSNLGIMSTLGVTPPGSCHYPPAGYAEIARLICPLVKRDNYHVVFANPITPPDLVRVYYPTEKKDEIVMEFDQPVKWGDNLVNEFYLDGESGLVVSGSRSGNSILLKLAAASSAKSITYLDSKDWSQERLLRGENGIAALTFCEVPILSLKPAK